MLDNIWKEMLSLAGNARSPRDISDCVSAGGVGAAVLSESGKIYIGVCIDTACTLGICAERNAIFNMISCGEDRIKRVVCVMGDGRTGAPCGACRELMVQLMPNGYKDIEILLDAEAEEIITLGELTPKWWI